MKIIVFENNYSTHNKSERDTLFTDGYPTVYTLPDTALLKDHRPFFIPDFADTCSMQMHLVVRICRLGRSISARFAHRYYDALSVGVTFTADNLLSSLQQNRMPWELAKGFDGAAALGSFVPLEKLDEGLCSHFSIRTADQMLMEGCGGEMSTKVDDLIAEISKYYTLKQGDFLFTGCPVSPVQVEPDMPVSGYIGENKVLSFNIK